MKTTGITAICFIIIFMVKIIIREEKRKRKNIQVCINNQRVMENQIKDWTKNYQPINNYSADDYICPSKMHNGEQAEISLIERRSYMDTVRIVFRK